MGTSNAYDTVKYFVAYIDHVAELQEYNVKVLFSRNAFLVDIAGTSAGRVLKLDTISPEDQKLWTGVDVMIFNTWHWWLHTGRKQAYVQHF